MIKLSNEEMKKIIGGEAPPIKCNLACAKWNTETQETQAGTCSIKNGTIDGLPYQYCDCSVSGGSGC